MYFLLRLHNVHYCHLLDLQTLFFSWMAHLKTLYALSSTLSLHFSEFFFNIYKSTLGSDEMIIDFFNEGVLLYFMLSGRISRNIGENIFRCYTGTTSEIPIFMFLLPRLIARASQPDGNMTSFTLLDEINFDLSPKKTNFISFISTSWSSTDVFSAPSYNFQYCHLLDLQTLLFSWMAHLKTFYALSSTFSSHSSEFFDINLLLRVQ